jgi:tRNA-dependent cyclodipeptide synthase
VLDERGTALVWMSAGNSYFKENVIKRILNFTGANFNNVLVMAPDEPAEHTFRALGYTGNDIKKKARINAKLLQNRARRIVTSYNQTFRSKFHVVEWIDEIMSNNVYRESLKEITKLFNSNLEFRKDALSTTKKVLDGKTSERTMMPNASEEGVNYLLKELAFVVASPVMFKSKKVTYVYHHEWPIFQKLITGEYDGIRRENCGFLLFE